MGEKRLETSNEFVPRSAAIAEPYRTSWANRCPNWVVGLPGSSLVMYLGLWIVLTLLQVIALWAEGADPIALFQVPQAFLAGAIAFMTGIFRYFNQRAAQALAIMKPIGRTGAASRGLPPAGTSTGIPSSDSRHRPVSATAL